MEKNRKRENHFYLLYAVICISIFVVILFCNLRTPLLVDDYAYAFSFHSSSGEKQRVETVSDIFSSMNGYRLTMNGRIVANFFVQLFVMLSSSAFDILNAAIFVLELVLITELSAVYIPSEKRQKRKPLMFLFTFAAVWIFQPVFGQVNLWLYGSINYLWAAVLSLGLMGFYLKMYREEDFSMNLLGKIGFLIYSFIVGTWCEFSGGAILILEIILLFLMKFQQKRKLPLVSILSAEITLAGILFNITAPGALKSKTGELNLGNLLSMLSELFTNFKSFWVLWAVIGVLFVLAICAKVEKQTITVASLSILTALVASLFLVFGSSIEESSLFFTTTLLILTCCILISALWDLFKIQILCLVCLVGLAFPYYFFTGVNDINTCYYAFLNNETEMVACVEAGEDAAEISYVYPETKYTASYGLQYINQSDPGSSPNDTMAAYYGVGTVKAKE